MRFLTPTIELAPDETRVLERHQALLLPILRSLLPVVECLLLLGAFSWYLGLDGLLRRLVGGLLLAGALVVAAALSALLVPIGVSAESGDGDWAHTIGEPIELEYPPVSK